MTKEIGEHWSDCDFSASNNRPSPSYRAFGATAHSINRGMKLIPKCFLARFLRQCHTAVLRRGLNVFFSSLSSLASSARSGRHMVRASLPHQPDGAALRLILLRERRQRLVETLVTQARLHLDRVVAAERPVAVFTVSAVRAVQLEV